MKKSRFHFFFLFLTWLVQAVMVAPRLHAEDGAYQYTIESDVPGARVYVGSSFKGVTPYTSQWVKGVSSVTYTLVPGCGPVTKVTIQGTPGQTATRKVVIEKFSESFDDPPRNAGGLNVRKAQMILDGIRLPFDRLDLVGGEFQSALAEEASAGFPNIGMFLSASLKSRIARALRVSQSTGETVSLLPWMGGTEGSGKSRSKWSASEVVKATDDSCVVDLGVGEAFILGEFDYLGPEAHFEGGWHGNALFIKEDGDWRLDQYQDIGQDDPGEN